MGSLHSYAVIERDSIPVVAEVWIVIFSVVNFCAVIGCFSIPSSRRIIYAVAVVVNRVYLNSVSATVISDGLFSDKVVSFRHSQSSFNAFSASLSCVSMYATVRFTSSIVLNSLR